MLDSGSVLAGAAVLTILGGVFLWVVTMIVKSAITEAINGFKTNIALMAQQVKGLKEELEKETLYSHGVMHDRIGKIGALQLDAFNAGREMGRISHSAKE